MPRFIVAIMSPRWCGSNICSGKTRWGPCVVGRYFVGNALRMFMTCTSSGASSHLAWAEPELQVYGGQRRQYDSVDSRLEHMCFAIMRAMGPLKNHIAQLRISKRMSNLLCAFCAGICTQC